MSALHHVPETVAGLGGGRPARPGPGGAAGKFLYQKLRKLT